MAINVCYVVVFLSKQVSLVLKLGVGTENCQEWEVSALYCKDHISIELQERLELKSKPGTFLNGTMLNK